jgi:hypothetical protein
MWPDVHRHTAAYYLFLVHFDEETLRVRRDTGETPSTRADPPARLGLVRRPTGPAALALLYRVDRAPSPALWVRSGRCWPPGGFAVPGKPELRLRTLADVFAYADAEGVELRIDGTEVQVRRPKANRPGRRAFVSGKKKQNTIKPTVISDGKGRLLWCGAIRPGRMHDVTAVRTEGIEDLLRRYPTVRARVDSGYQGLARDFGDQVSAPPPKPPNDATARQRAEYNAARKAQSSQRICVEHAIAEPKQWRPLQRYIGRRERFEDTVLAIAGLVSDRCAER